MQMIQKYEMICNDSDLLAIQSKFNIDEERFVQGVIFAENIVRGESANNSYALAFDCELKEANTKSSNLRNSKWIQEIIKYIKPDQETLYFGEIRQIIRKGMEIIDNPYSEVKDKVAAMNALAKYIKTQTNKNQNEQAKISDSGKLIVELMKGIAELGLNDKMIGRDGTIIDVPILE